MSLAPARLCPAGHRVTPPGRCPLCLKARDRERTQPLRHLYCTARWFALRAQVLNANPLCVQCARDGRVTVAQEIDHVVPHQGDVALFWNPLNLQGLCSTHHVQKTRRGE